MQCIVYIVFKVCRVCKVCMQKSRVSEEDEYDDDEGDVDDGKSHVPEPTSYKPALLTPGHATGGRRRSGKQMSIVVLLKF